MLATNPTSIFFGRHHCSRCHGLRAFFLAGRESFRARYVPPRPFPPTSPGAFEPSSGHVHLAPGYRLSPLTSLRPRRLRHDGGSAAPCRSAHALPLPPDSAPVRSRPSLGLPHTS